MTKRELLKWLEAKRDKVIFEAKEKYTEAYDILRQNAIEHSDLPLVAAQIEDHLDAALKLWRDWKELHKEDEGFSFQKHSYTFDCVFYSFTASKGDTLQHLRANSISIKTPEMECLNQEYKAIAENIRTNYTNVIAVAQSLSGAKEITRYLEGLGFNLTELMPQKESVTALTVQIDTTYLFLNQDRNRGIKTKR